MPSAFELQMTSAGQGPLYDAFGVAAVYAGPDGSTQACTARVQRDEARQDGGGTGKSNVQAELQTAHIYLKASEVTAPQAGGRITTGVEVWSIEVKPKLQNGQHHCICRRTGATRHAPRREAGA